MKHKRKRGIALVIVLGVVLVLVIAATAFMLMSSTEIQMARKQNDSTQAFYLAEAGLQRARYDLEEDSDWTDGVINGVAYDIPKVLDSDGFYLLKYANVTGAILDGQFSGGEFVVRLKDIAGEDDEIWVKSRGIYSGTERAVQARIKRVGSFGGLPITSAIEAEGSADPGGSATVTGDIRDNINSTISSAASAGATTISLADASEFKVNDTIVIDKDVGGEETKKITAITDSTLTLDSALLNDHIVGADVNRILDFEDIFGMSKAEVEAIAEEYAPDEANYYNRAFNSTNDVATGLTWVSAPGTESQITPSPWGGSGVFIVEGDLRITGGTFNGVIWVIGTLFIGGGANISGAIFAESGVTADTTVTGNAEIAYSASDVDDGFNILNGIPSILDWREVP